MNLAAVAFRLLGIKVTFRHILYAFLAIVIAVLLYLAFDKVRDHFNGIVKLENQVIQLNKDKDQLQKDLDEAARINDENQTMWQAEREGRIEAEKIANSEQASSEVRVAKHKEIQRVIDSSTRTLNPIDPVIRTTLDSLWDQEGSDRARK